MQSPSFLFRVAVLLPLVCAGAGVLAEDTSVDTDFFERRIRPVLVEHCYECHSEQAGEQQGGLLLDRQSGWLEGGDTNKAIIPGEPEASLFVAAIRYDDDSLQMPPDGRLEDDQIALLERWISGGAPGPADDMGDTEFSTLGDQDLLFQRARDHWAFQPVQPVNPPPASDPAWDRRPIDRLVYSALSEAGLTPSRRADASTLVRRMFYDLTGLPPTIEDSRRFQVEASIDFERAVDELTDRLIDSPEYGQHIARMWLDVARYADTDSAYRPDTRTPHYFPFAFTYRDYVVDALNADKPFDQFLQEQLAADQMGFSGDDPEVAALGFLAAGPYANRDQGETLDDWIDLTTRGLMGVTVACARCHDHKFEPIPTADYYSLRGIFAAVRRVHPLDEEKQPEIRGYHPSEAERADFQERRAEIEAKIEGAAGKKARNNNRSISEKIRETELAELLLFHPGAPARAMSVSELPKPPPAFVLIRGDAAARGKPVDRHFLSVLDRQQTEFPADSSGRLELAKCIASPENPLTARVLVNRVWGSLIGTYLVATPSDFGLQGSPPTHPELLDYLADDFVKHGWSIKHLVRCIVRSQTYQQSGRHRESAEVIDPRNELLWRANRKRLSIEAIRDSVLAVSGNLDRRVRGRAEKLWGEDYTRRRALYGFINRFNLDPTLRAFDFPAPLQTQPSRGESIVAPQALFTMNSPFVIDQVKTLTQSSEFGACGSDEQRIDFLFQRILGRSPASNELTRTLKLVEFQSRFKKPSRPGRFILSPWPLIAQALIMSNEFQYVD